MVAHLAFQSKRDVRFDPIAQNFFLTFFTFFLWERIFSYIFVSTKTNRYENSKHNYEKHHHQQRKRIHQKL